MFAAAHKDVAVFDSHIVLLSLNSASVMTFAHRPDIPCDAGRANHKLPNESAAHERHSCDVDLLPRSAVILSGDARYDYTHAIKERKWDRLADGRVIPRRTRYSLTLRRVLT